MSNKKITLKNTDENDMTSTIELENLNKTKVNFGFSPDKVEYIGEVNIEDLKKLEEEQKNNDE
jgi:hypothetical protein